MVRSKRSAVSISTSRPGKCWRSAATTARVKSSLVKIIAGRPAAQWRHHAVARPGRVAFHSPQDALRQGIATIYQDLALAPRLSIAQNVFLGSELTRGPLGLPFPRLLDKRRMVTEARGYLQRLNLPQADMGAAVERLSGGQRQAVAIARALRWQAELIIMDEPTAALGRAGDGAGAGADPPPARRRAGRCC
jgi:simple sugar transport system ATP-binding protein